jgi:hypothetical protein
MQSSTFSCIEKKNFAEIYRGPFQVLSIFETTHRPATHIRWYTKLLRPIPDLADMPPLGRAQRQGFLTLRAGRAGRMFLEDSWLKMPIALLMRVASSATIASRNGARR